MRKFMYKKFILNSSNSDLKFRPVASQGRIYKRKDIRLKSRIFFAIFRYKKAEINDEEKKMCVEMK